MLATSPQNNKLLHSWPIEQGRATLYLDSKEMSYFFLIQKKELVTRVGVESISGLPSNLSQLSYPQQSSYFDKTFLILNPKSEVGYSIHVQNKLLGGMLTKDKTKRKKDNKDISSNNNNNNCAPKRPTQNNSNHLPATGPKAAVGSNEKKEQTKKTLNKNASRNTANEASLMKSKQQPVFSFDHAISDIYYTINHGLFTNNYVHLLDALNLIDDNLLPRRYQSTMLRPLIKHLNYLTIDGFNRLFDANNRADLNDTERHERDRIKQIAETLLQRSYEQKHYRSAFNDLKSIQIFISDLHNRLIQNNSLFRNGVVNFVRKIISNQQNSQIENLSNQLTELKSEIKKIGDAEIVDSIEKTLSVHGNIDNRDIQEKFEKIIVKCTSIKNGLIQAKYSVPINSQPNRNELIKEITELNRIVKKIADLTNVYCSDMPPLAKWGKGEFRTSTVKACSKLYAGNYPINIPGFVNIPTELRNRGILAWASLAHEVGGHHALQTHSRIVPELGENIRKRLAGHDKDIVDYWEACTEEIASDIMAILNLGPSFIISMISYLQSPYDIKLSHLQPFHSKEKKTTHNLILKFKNSPKNNIKITDISEDVSINHSEGAFGNDENGEPISYEKEYFPSNKHPHRIFRLMVMQYCVNKLFKDHCLINAIQSEVLRITVDGLLLKRRDGTSHPIGQGDAYTISGKVAEAILSEKMECLDGKTFLDFPVWWTQADNEIVTTIQQQQYAGAIGARSKKNNQANLIFDSRHIVAAAIQESLSHSNNAEQIFSTMKHLLTLRDEEVHKDEKNTHYKNLHIVTTQHKNEKNNNLNIMHSELINNNYPTYKYEYNSQSREVIFVTDGTGTIIEACVFAKTKVGFKFISTIDAAKIINEDDPNPPTLDTCRNLEPKGAVRIEITHAFNPDPFEEKVIQLSFFTPDSSELV